MLVLKFDLTAISYVWGLQKSRSIFKVVLNTAWYFYGMNYEISLFIFRKHLIKENS